MNRTDEYAWVIERGLSPLLYWCGGTAWSPDNAEAIRFSRERDAAAVLARSPVLFEGARVCEHGWMS